MRRLFIYIMLVTFFSSMSIAGPASFTEPGVGQPYLDGGDIGSIPSAKAGCVIGDSLIDQYCATDSATPEPDNSQPNNNSNSSGSNATQGPPSSPSVSSQQAAQCMQQFQAAQQKCESAYQATGSRCDEANSSDMQGVKGIASQLALMMGGQTASNIQAACSKMGSLSQAASGALAAYRMQCGSSINACKSSCSELVNFVRQNSVCFSGAVAGMPSYEAQTQAIDSARRCNDFDPKMNEANQAVQNYAATSANAKQCAEDSSGGMETYCSLNPTALSCAATVAGNCSDPTEAATNKICVCAANPHHSMCLTGQSAAASLGVAGGMIDSSSRLAESVGDAGDDLYGTPSIQHGALPSSGSGGSLDGRQGSANPVGDAGGGGGVSPRAGKSAAAAGDSTSGGGGFFGGGGKGIAGFVGRLFSSGDKAGGKNGAGAASPGAGTPDLRQFLPGGLRDPRSRGIAGINGGTGIDGITGPHTNIWTKVQNRYRVISPSLMP